MCKKTFITLSLSAILLMPFSVMANKVVRTQIADKGISAKKLDFAGRFSRIYSAKDSLAYQLKVLDSLKIEPLKNKPNQYQITFESDDAPFTTVAKREKSGRGFSFELDNYLNGQVFYGVLNQDTLTLYADPDSGRERVLTYKRVGDQPLSESVKFPPKEYNKISLEHPIYTEPLGKNTNFTALRPALIAEKWLSLSENYTVELEEMLNAERYFEDDKAYGIVLMKSPYSNKDDSVVRDAGENYIDRFVVVDPTSKDYKKEALDCDELQTGAGIQTIPLNHGVKGYLALTDYVSNTSPSFLSVKLPSPSKKGDVCVALNYGTDLSYYPEKLNEGIKLLNKVIHDFAQEK